MRCSCQNCGTYMAQSEGLEKGCICPECGTRCKQCLGTDSVISRADLRSAAIRFFIEAQRQESSGDE